MVNFEGVPKELRAFRSWVLWKYEHKDGQDKPTKVPYSALAGHRASPIDSFHWCNFEDVKNAYLRGGYDGIGFVLSTNDPYCVIDLDQARDDVEALTVKRIYEDARSFTEYSPSGTGLHIWTKASVSRGRKKHPVEIYSSARFMTVTGNVLWNMPIDYRQDFVDNEYAKIPSAQDELYTSYDGLDAPSGTDQEVCDKASSASNGEKFIDLWHGRFDKYYNSQSEADFALINIIAFYTQNSEQIARLFRFSALGQRAKAQRFDYLDKMIRRSFDKMPPKQQLATLKESMDAIMQGMLQNQAQQAALAQQDAQPIMQAPLTERVTEDMAILKYNDASDDVIFPDGLIGEIAEHLYRTSPRPVREISLAGALGMIAGMCGSAFNVSGTGLNVYLCVLASTGTGKDALGKPLSNLIEQVRMMSPSVDSFFGVGDFGSAQGLLRHLSDTSRSFCAQVGECGLWLAMLSNPMANDKNVGTRRLLLDLYGKSGKGSVIRPTVYSDSSKNSKPIRNPAVTLLGDSTQTKFFEAIDESIIAEGFIPRWIIVEYKGGRVPLNKAHNSYAPDVQMIQRIAELSQMAHSIMEGLTAIEVPLSEEVAVLADEFDRFCDAQINSTPIEAIKSLWTRVYLNALKVAALCAVGRDFRNPIVQKQDWEFGKWLVVRATKSLVSRYREGTLTVSVAVEENKQREAICECLAFYLKADDAQLHAYKCDKMLRDVYIVPWSYISRKIKARACFNNKKLMGSQTGTYALEKALKEACSAGLLTPVPSNQMKTQFNKTGMFWTISDVSQLDKYLHKDFVHS